MLAIGALLLSAAACLALDLPMSELYARDLEHFPGPLIDSGQHKFISGGAGEGSQLLNPDGTFAHRQEVKTDAVLPAYCEPPNPCPIGFTEADGCTEQFENTADFSRAYQARQNCLCDEEHMFNCPDTQDVAEPNDAIERLLSASKVDQHKTLVAKKFHSKRGQPR